MNKNATIKIKQKKIDEMENELSRRDKKLKKLETQLSVSNAEVIVKKKDSQED